MRTLVDTRCQQSEHACPTTELLLYTRNDAQVLRTCWQQSRREGRKSCFSETSIQELQRTSGATTPNLPRETKKGYQQMEHRRRSQERLSKAKQSKAKQSNAPEMFKRTEQHHCQNTGVSKTDAMAMDFPACSAGVLPAPSHHQDNLCLQSSAKLTLLS